MTYNIILFLISFFLYYPLRNFSGNVTNVANNASTISNNFQVPYFTSTLCTPNNVVINDVIEDNNNNNGNCYVGLDQLDNIPNEVRYIKHAWFTFEGVNYKVTSYWIATCNLVISVNFINYGIITSLINFNQGCKRATSSLARLMWSRAPMTWVLHLRFVSLLSYYTQLY